MKFIIVYCINGGLVMRQIGELSSKKKEQMQHTKS